jgi:hypothetical protein
VIAQEHVHAIMQLVGMVWTGLNTPAAGKTSVGKVAEFRLMTLTLGIVAPETTHRATFEEHSGADARSVVQGEALNVEDNICGDHGDTVKGGKDGEGV